MINCKTVVRDLILFRSAYLYPMQKEILLKLAELEKQNDVRILYACESGSRAWGFASPDSDFDVRFVYVQNRNKYLSIYEPRDVIEVPVNEILDINGWDLRKALGLFRKSNAPLYEWLQSPIVYRSDEKFAAEFRALMPAYFSMRAGFHHYFSMARNAFENDLQGELVRIKKYFYALRPLLAASWIIEKQEVPPMEFEPLRGIIKDPVVQHAIDQLLELKKTSNEKTTIAPLPELQFFLAENLLRCKAEGETLLPNNGDTAVLDSFFRSWLTV